MSNPYKARKALPSGTTPYFNAWQTLKLPVIYYYSNLKNKLCQLKEKSCLCQVIIGTFPFFFMTNIFSCKIAIILMAISCVVLLAAF